MGSNGKFFPYNRTDYIQHPMEKPWVRQPEQYMRPQGNMDTTTSYKKDYTGKL